MSEHKHNKNPMSNEPGHDVTLIHEIHDGTFTTLESQSYDWVQVPYVYIKTVLKADTPTKRLSEAWVNGELKWRRNDPTSPWEFK
jgi:hypothetical protein